MRLQTGVAKGHAGAWCASGTQKRRRGWISAAGWSRSTAPNWVNCSADSTRWWAGCANVSAYETYSAAMSDARSPKLQNSNRFNWAAKSVMLRCFSSTSSARPVGGPCGADRGDRTVESVLRRHRRRSGSPPRPGEQIRGRCCAGRVRCVASTRAARGRRVVRRTLDSGSRLRGSTRLPGWDRSERRPSGCGQRRHQAPVRIHRYRRPVNEAARLCELAKSRPGRVLASADALDCASQSERVCGRVDSEVVLRGRDEPTRVAVSRPC